RVASTPSMRGIRTSMSTTSTSVVFSSSSAASPSPASATTSMSGWAPSTILNPARNSSWSSTSITRITPGPPFLCRLDHGQPGQPLEAAALPGAHGHGAAVHADPLAHADQAVAVQALRGRRAPAVVGHAHDQLRAPIVDLHECSHAGAAV